MTVKTLYGTVTAPVNILNVLSLGYSNMADSYEEAGLHLSANEYRTISHEIYSVLEKAGYYSSPQTFGKEEEKPGEFESKSRESETVNGLKVRRNVLSDDVRSMCIRYGFYTQGSCSDYGSMLSSCDGYFPDDLLEQTATDIVEHSSVKSLEAAFGSSSGDAMSYYITCMVEMLVNDYSRTFAFY